MTFTLNIEPPKADIFPVEQEAKDWTWRKWLRRDRGVLFEKSELSFDPNHIELTLHRWNEAFAWKAVGIIPPLDEAATAHTPCIVGRWLPASTKSWIGGAEVRLQSLGGPGSTHHRGLGLVGWVYVLPDFYQRYVARRDDDDDYNDRSMCGNCPYLFKEDEVPCPDCLRCANCCHGQGFYPERCADADARLLTEHLEKHKERNRAA